MKKIYKNPETMVVKVHTSQMMTTISMYGQDAEGAAMSRRGGRSVWDEDEDDDY